VFICFIFTFIVSAQEKPGVVFQRYDKSDGLSSNRIGDIAQDADGFIWIATGNSLQRFDGHYFRTYTTANEPALLSNAVKRIYIDSKNRLWLYDSYKGLGLWDLNTGEKQNFTPKLNDSSSLPDHRVFDIYEDRNNTIWLSIHLKGIARFNEKTQDFSLFNIDRILPEPERRGVNTTRTMIDHPAQKDELLIGSFNGLFVLNKKTKAVKQLPIGKDNAEKPSQINGYEDIILDIYIQNDSTLWIATFGGGILKYDLNTQTYRSIKIDSPFPRNQIKNNFHQISKKDDNNLWVTIYNKGLFILNLENESLTMVNKKADGKSEMQTVLKFLKGKFGHLWLSSDKGLIKIYTNKGFTDYQYVGYPIDDIEEDVQDKLKLVLPQATDHVVIYDENWDLIKKLYYEPVRKFDFKLLIGLHRYQGQYFLQGFEGLYRLDSSLSQIKPVQPFFEQLKENGRLSIISSFIDSKGNLWMGTKVKGIFRYDIPNEKLYHYNRFFEGSQPHSNRWIFSFYEDSSGLIWFGSEAGYCFYDPKSEKFSNFPYPQNSKALDNIYLKECVGFAENPNGDMWVGSRESGLALFDRQNFAEPKFLLNSEKHFRNKLLDKVFEHNQNLYLHFNEGFSIVDKTSKASTNFTKAFGVNHIRDITKNGQLVIGNGFASPERLDYQNIPSPKIYIDDLIIAGKKVIFNGENIKIDFENNSISLRLGILDFVEKERAQLQYSLSGAFNDNWTSANSGQLLSFPYLDKGDYTLKIRAISPSGKIWETKTIPIEIIPMFWQRWWVRILIVLILISLIAFPLIYRYRQKKQARELKLGYEKEIEDLKRKALKAQINPHFLFNSLNSIRLLVMKGNIEDASEGISTFSRLVRKILNHSERDEVSLKEEIQSTKEYVKLEQMRFKKPFEFEVMMDSDVQLGSIYIPPMLIQPFLENAIWHGLRYKNNNGKLSIKIEKDNKNKNVIIFIRDNGIGRKASVKFTSETKKSFGIKISSERLKHFNDSKIDDIYIHDLKDENGEAKGTLVEIRVKHK